MGACEPSKAHMRTIPQNRTRSMQGEEIGGSGGSFDVREAEDPRERRKRVEKKEVNEYANILSDNDYEIGMKDIGQSPINPNSGEKVQWSNRSQKPNSLVPPKPKHSLWASKNGENKFVTGAAKLNES